jgi:hypothetical protein
MKKSILSLSLSLSAVFILMINLLATSALAEISTQGGVSISDSSSSVDVSRVPLEMGKEKFYAPLAIQCRLEEEGALEGFVVYADVLSKLLDADNDFEKGIQSGDKGVFKAFYTQPINGDGSLLAFGELSFEALENQKVKFFLDIRFLTGMTLETIQMSFLTGDDEMDSEDRKLPVTFFSSPYQDDAAIVEMKCVTPIDDIIHID